MDINTFQLKMLGKYLLKLTLIMIMMAADRSHDRTHVRHAECTPGLCPGSQPEVRYETGTHDPGDPGRKGPGGRHHQPGPGHGRGSKSGEPGPRQGRRSGHLEGQTLRGYPGSGGRVHQRGKDLKSKARGLCLALLVDSMASLTSDVSSERI